MYHGVNFESQQWGFRMRVALSMLCSFLSFAISTRAYLHTSVSFNHTQSKREQLHILIIMSSGSSISMRFSNSSRNMEYLYHMFAHMPIYISARVASSSWSLSSSQWSRQSLPAR